MMLAALAIAVVRQKKKVRRGDDGPFLNPIVGFGGRSGMARLGGGLKRARGICAELLDGAKLYLGTPQTFVGDCEAV